VDISGRDRSGAEEMIAEARRALFVMVGFLAVLWGIQCLNWADHYDLSRDHGLLSGELGRLPDVFVAPLLHWNWMHIESNSGPLFVFGCLAAYRGVARFAVLTVLVATTSGLAVWFFEDANLDTVGASGLVFGYFGYVVVRGLFDRHLVDTLIGVVMAASFAYILTVAVPGTPGVSWLGHLGGLVGGVAGAWLLRDRRPAGAAPSRQPGKAVTARGAEHPRASLHQELEDLGLL
jgi:membrane associated rhomboid family serine protease